MLCTSSSPATPRASNGRKSTSVSTRTGSSTSTKPDSKKSLKKQPPLATNQTSSAKKSQTRATSGADTWLTSSNSTTICRKKSHSYKQTHLPCRPTSTASSITSTNGRPYRHSPGCNRKKRKCQYSQSAALQTSGLVACTSSP